MRTLILILVGLALRHTLWRTMGDEPLILDLPPYQRPEKIHLVDHFPRTDTGKLRRNELARRTA